MTITPDEILTIARLRREAAAFADFARDARDDRPSDAAYYQERSAEFYAAARELLGLESTTYRLLSSAFIYTPGVLAWAMNGYLFEDSREKMLGIFVEGYKLPADAAEALLSGKVPYVVCSDESVLFHFNHTEGLSS